jgi:hypothetical protein
MAKGDSTADITQDTAISAVTGLAKNLVNAQVIEGQLNAYADFETGRTNSIDAFEEQMIDAAGSGVLNAGLAYAGGKGYLAKHRRCPPSPVRWSVVAGWSRVDLRTLHDANRQERFHDAGRTEASRASSKRGRQQRRAPALRGSLSTPKAKRPILDPECRPSGRS